MAGEQVTVLGRVTRKEEGGKLYSVDVEADGGRIKKVRISGEFFANPEDLVDVMEASLTGASLELTPVTQAIVGALFWSRGTLVGVGASDLAAAIVEAGRERAAV
jgi:lipoate-protein ligase A